MQVGNLINFILMFFNSVMFLLFGYKSSTTGVAVSSVDGRIYK